MCHRKKEKENFLRRPLRSHFLPLFSPGGPTTIDVTQFHPLFLPHHTSFLLSFPHRGSWATGEEKIIALYARTKDSLLTWYCFVCQCAAGGLCVYVPSSSLKALFSAELYTRQGEHGTHSTFSEERKTFGGWLSPHFKHCHCIWIWVQDCQSFIAVGQTLCYFETQN